ncbi:MAG: hypothetical protein KKC01_11555 [Gammaproteobacteria bacterium]|nr:hypothetical protein [Gammaproteobacteria bacterium]
MHGKVITTIDEVALLMLFCHDHGADETTMLLSMKKQRKCRAAPGHSIMHSRLTAASWPH